MSDGLLKGMPREADPRGRLGLLLRAALADFPREEYRKVIHAYVLELEGLLEQGEAVEAEGEEAQSSDGVLASVVQKELEAEDEEPGEDELTLLYKFEAYLESIMMGTIALKSGSS